MNKELEITMYDNIFSSNNLISRKKHLVLNFRTQDKEKDKNILFVEN